MGEIRSKTCEQGNDRRDQLERPACAVTVTRCRDSFDGRPLLPTDRHTMDVSFSGKPSDHIFEQEPGRPLEAFAGPFAEHVFGKSPEQLAMEEEEKSDETQADGQSSGVSNGVRIKRGFPSQWEKIAAGGPEYIRDEVSAATLGLCCRCRNSL